MATAKRSRIQVYLPPDLADEVRQLAHEEREAESQAAARLVKAGLAATKTGYNLGGVAFRTKDEIRAHVRAVRDATPLGARIEDPVVLALMSLHPDWEEKTRGGGWLGTALIHHPSRSTPSKEIAVCFDDSDKVVDISWSKLLPLLSRGESVVIPQDNRLQELRAAARQEIEGLIAPLRKPGHHVDHVYPATFDFLLWSWLTSHNLRVSDVPIGYAAPPDPGRYMANPAHAVSWINYHQRCGVLEVIPAKEHHSRTDRSNLDWTALL
jgi:hypothetical protein